MTTAAVETRRCIDVASDYHDQAAVSDEAWGIMVALAAAQSSEGAQQNQEDALRLSSQGVRNKQRRLLGLFATHPCLSEDDLIVDGQDGLIDFTEDLSYFTGIPVIHTTVGALADRLPIVTLATSGSRELRERARRPVVIKNVVNDQDGLGITRFLLASDADAHLLALGRHDLGGEADEASASEPQHFVITRYIPPEMQDFKLEAAR